MSVPILLLSSPNRSPIFQVAFPLPNPTSVGYNIPMPDTSRASLAAALSVMPPTKSRIFI